jgi:hypothetical protein
MTRGVMTLAASRLSGLDAAPAPRLATDKTTARPSAKRRRIQLPPTWKVGFWSYAPLSDDCVMVRVGGNGVNTQKSQICVLNGN